MRAPASSKFLHFASSDQMIWQTHENLGECFTKSTQIAKSYAQSGYHNGVLTKVRSDMPPKLSTSKIPVSNDESFRRHKSCINKAHPKRKFSHDK